MAAPGPDRNGVKRSGTGNRSLLGKYNGGVINLPSSQRNQLEPKAIRRRQQRAEERQVLHY